MQNQDPTFSDEQPDDPSIREELAAQSEDLLARTRKLNERLRRLNQEVRSLLDENHLPLNSEEE